MEQRWYDQIKYSWAKSMATSFIIKAPRFFYFLNMNI